MTTVDIQTPVSLQEERSLTDYYRNRTLVLAQAVADLVRENAALKSQILAEAKAEEDQG